LTINLKNTLLVLTALLTWSLIFIDGATDEGPIIKFLLNGLQTSNLKNKIIDIVSIISLLTAAYFLIRQDFRRIVFSLVYIALLLNIIRHIDFRYSSWFMQTKTILPTILFLTFSLTSILSIKNRTSKT
jgi:hypothetical protein